MARVLIAASTANFATTVFGLGNSSAFHVVGFYPHITALEVVAEEGILGAIIYFAILFLAFRNAIRISRNAALSASDRNALAILTGLFVFELILSWKQGSLLFSVYVFAYAIVLARLETPALKRAHDSAHRATMLENTPRFPNLLR
jgi:O-antigen ligase